MYTNYSFLDIIPLDYLIRILSTRNAIHASAFNTRTFTKYDESTKRAVIYRCLFSKYGFSLLFEGELGRELMFEMVNNRFCKDEISALLSKFSLDFREVNNVYDVLDTKILNEQKLWKQLFRLCSAKLHVPEVYLRGQNKQLGNGDFSVLLQPVADSPPLHEYQKVVYDKLIDFLRHSTDRSTLLHLPTGLGKTRISLEAIISLLNSAENSCKVIWVTDRKELKRQVIDQFNGFWATLGESTVQYSHISNGEKLTNELKSLDNSFIVCTKQLIRQNSDKIRKEVHSESLVIFVDEVHRECKELYGILQDLLEKFIQIKVVGLTATPPEGNDNEEFIRLFGEPNRYLGRGIATKDSIQDYLSRHQSIQPEFIEFGSEYSERDSTELEYIESRNEEICEKISELVGDGKKVLVFACSNPHGKKLADLLAMNLIRAEFVGYQTKSKQRNDIVERFKNGQLDVLLNYEVLSTGFDDPNIDAILIARPIQSDFLYLQIVGRGIRAASQVSRKEKEFQVYELTKSRKTDSYTEIKRKYT